jgi:hypothetical protein
VFLFKKTMKTSVIVFTIVGALIVCLCVLCAAALGLTLITVPTVTLPTFPTLPPRNPTETAVPLQHSPDDAGEGTLRVLTEAIIPENDPADLAYRLGGIAGPIPETVPAPASPPTVGSSETFWASDTDTNENFQLTAVLQYTTAHTYFWVEEGVSFDMAELVALAEDFENFMYPTVREFFGPEWTPGIDNDPRIYILYATGIGNSIAGYFSSADEVHPLAHEYSNAHEMFFLSADNTGLDEVFTYGVLAHEFQHMIHWNGDRNEENWINEGFSEVAALLTGYYDGGFDSTYTRDPDIPLTAWPEDGPKTPHYGGAFLYLAYLLDRFGDELTREIVSHPENGMTAIDIALAETGAEDPLRGTVPTADTLFQDFAAALYLLDPNVADGRYDFTVYDDAPQTDENETVTSCPSNPLSRDVNQYGIDYIRITCGGEHTLVFEGSTAIPVLPQDPYSGDYAFWSNRGDEADMTLTRQFDFTGVSGPISIEYRTWYEIEAGYDYVYLLASTDGETWEILTTPSGTAEDPSGNSYGWAYNGNSRGWLLESVDLSGYAGMTVWLRFEYITDAAVNGEGLLLDDVAIPAIGYFSDFEADDGGWEAAGFVRLQNVLPQTFVLSLITFGDAGTEVEYLALDADNRIEIPLSIGGDVDEVVLVISGTTRFTRQQTGYLIELRNLVPALPANPVHLEQVALHRESELGCQHFHQVLRPAVVELDHLVALVADQVVVVAAGHQDVVHRPAALENRVHEAQVRQQVEGAVDRHPPDPGRFFADPGDEVIRRDVASAADQGLGDRPAGVCQPVAGSDQPGCQCFGLVIRVFHVHIFRQA